MAACMHECMDAQTYKAYGAMISSPLVSRHDIYRMAPDFRLAFCFPQLTESVFSDHNSPIVTFGIASGDDLVATSQ